MSTKIRIQEPMTRESLMKIIKKNRGTEGWNLSGCNMAGINLTGLDLRGIVLSEWDEKQGGWSAANLSNANIQAVNFADAKLCGVDFNEATLEDADMPGANLAMANFACANLQHADLTNANVGGCDFTNANLRMAHLSQVDLRNAKSLSGVFLYQVILDQTRLRKDQLGGAIGDELTGKNPEEARDAYLALKQNFENIGDYNSSSWVYVKERQMEKLWTKQQAQEEWKKRKIIKSLRLQSHWASALVVELLCNYGESVWRVIGWIVFLILMGGPLLFALLGGLEDRDHTLINPFALNGYFQHVLYAIDTITTASFSELHPVTYPVRLLSGFLAMLGIFLAGLLGFVAGNRIRHS